MDTNDTVLKMQNVARPSSAALDIEFKDINYVTKKNLKGKSVHILRNLSGHLRAGRLTAILGPSGAGKSSLLNILSGVRTKGVSGTITLNKKLRGENFMRKHSAYIAQDVTLLPNITTFETLMFSADLKLTSEISIATKKETVNDVLILLGLQKCANSYVKNLSGGEKKRLSIGIELITNPQIMFFDEPTSGLDSVSAMQVMHHLKELTQSGRTIITVIHQPTSSLLELFDDLYVLADGRCMYNGPLEDMVSALKLRGFECPHYYNRADYALEVASLQRGENIDRLFEEFVAASGNDCAETDYLLITDKDAEHEANLEKATEKKMQYPISTWAQFLVLTKRTALCTFRDFHMCYMRVLCHILVGLLLGLVFYNIGNDAERVNSNASCLFFFLMFVFFANSMPVVLTYPQELGTLRREHLNNWYCLRAYYVSKIVADFPFVFTGTTCLIVIGYYLTGQVGEFYRMLLLLVVCLLTAFISQTIGFVSGAAFGMQMGTFIVPAMCIPVLIFSGFFVRYRELFDCLKPLTYISYFRYAYEGAINSIYGFNRRDLDCKEPFCYFSVKVFLKFLDMEENYYLMDVIGLAVWLILLQIILYVTLKWKVRKSM